MELPRVSSFALAWEADLYLQQHNEAVCCNGIEGNREAQRKFLETIALQYTSLCFLAAPAASSLPSQAGQGWLLPWQRPEPESPISHIFPLGWLPYPSAGKDADPDLPSPHTSSIPLPPAPNSEQRSTNPLRRDGGKAGKRLLTGMQHRWI